MITPLFDRVVLTKDKPKQSAIITNLEHDNIATVVAVGDVKHVKVGDKVLFNKYATTTIEIDNVSYILSKEIDILAIIN